MLLNTAIMLNHTSNLFLQTMFFLSHTRNDTIVEEIHNLESPWNGKDVYNKTQVETLDNKCYGEYGCYSLKYPWTNDARTLSQFPEDPSKMKPIYCLYTRHNPTQCQPLDHQKPETIYDSFLIPSHRTYIISHGFLEDGDRPWIKELTRQLLIKEDGNVIVNNWGAGSSPPYTQAVANIRLVGYMTAVLLNTLRREVGVRTEYVHLIGHSLGAHLSGYVGNTLHTVFGLKLGRITGLDPADPYFSGTEPIVRLDPTDATFVDIVHTDAAPFVKGGLGMGEPIGHLDFYPNGGENQPGCDQGVFKFIHVEKGSIVKGLRKYLGCDHIRSYEYFTESINSRCPFIAVECDSWANFTAGNCFNCLRNGGLSCAKFGFNAVKHRNSQLLALGRAVYKTVYDSKPFKYFLTTGEKSPFCRCAYRVTVHISNSTLSQEHRGEVGKFAIEIHGTKGKTEFMSLFKEQHYEPGAEHKQVVGGAGVGHITNITLRWEHEMSMNILTWRFEPALIYVSSVLVESLEEKQTIRLCNPSNEKIISGRDATLTECQSAPTPQISEDLDYQEDDSAS